MAREPAPSSQKLRSGCRAQCWPRAVGYVMLLSEADGEQDDEEQDEDERTPPSASTSTMPVRTPASTSMVAPAAAVGAWPAAAAGGVDGAHAAGDEVALSGGLGLDLGEAAVARPDLALDLRQAGLQLLVLRARGHLPHHRPVHAALGQLREVPADLLLHRAG